MLQKYDGAVGYFGCATARKLAKAIFHYEQSQSRTGPIELKIGKAWVVTKTGRVASPRNGGLVLPGCFFHAIDKQGHAIFGLG